jgi:bifunctional DNA-binding transcriptional regulator/antitoxin component of YhaV-PrlF toxin-antitoxin module
MAVKDDFMPKAHIRNGALTIPLTDEIREKLDVREGDELEAHVFPGSVVLRTTSPDAREQAWERLFSIIKRVHPTPEQARKPIDAVEDEIVEAVKETRRARRLSQQHE